MENDFVAIKIGQTIKSLLTTKNLSLRELSKASGVPYSTLQEWSGNRAPKNPLQAQKVASFLGVTLHFFLFGEEDQQETIQKIFKEDFFSGTFEINIKRIKTK